MGFTLHCGKEGSASFLIRDLDYLQFDLLSHSVPLRKLNSSLLHDIISVVLL